MDLLLFELCFCALLICTGFFAICAGVYMLQLKKNAKLIVGMQCFEHMKEVLNESPNDCD